MIIARRDSLHDERYADKDVCVCACERDTRARSCCGAESPRDTDTRELRTTRRQLRMPAASCGGRRRIRERERESGDPRMTRARKPAI